VSEKTYTVTGMTCGHCVAAVTSEVSSVPGVSDVTVELATGLVTVTGQSWTDAQIAEAVDEAGYAVAAA
jgi:copper chaperone